MSESKLTADIAKLARSLGFRVWTVNQTRGKPKFQMDPGVSDLIMFGHGHTVFVETKVGKNGQSTEQQDFQLAAIGGGSSYWVVRTEDDFLTRCKVNKWFK